MKEKEKFFSGKKVHTEINLDEVTKIRIVAMGLPTRSVTEVHDNNTYIGMGPRSVGTGEISEYEALVYKILFQVRSNNNIEYIKGDDRIRMLVLLSYPIFLWITVFFVKRVFIGLLTGQMFLVLTEIVPAILGPMVLILYPLWFINSKEKTFDPEVVLKYGPQILFNKLYRRDVYEQIGEDVSQPENKIKRFSFKGAFGGLLIMLCIGLITLFFVHNHYQRTAVLQAATNGTQKEVVAALNDGGSVNAKNDYDQTALMMAVEKNNLKVIKSLINSGAKVTAQGGWYYNHRTALMLAAKHRGSEVINTLIEAGADVNARDSDGMTALMLAASENNLEAVKALIDAGADVNLKKDYDDTALICAAIEPNQDVIKTLIDAGANVNSQNNIGKTALMYASEECNSPKIIKQLLNAGANVNLQDKDGKTALIYAIEDNDALGIQTLLQAGADVNIQDKDGKTALMYAAYENKYTEAINMLLDAGANASLQDEDRMTAANFARKNDHIRNTDAHSRLKQGTKSN